MWTPSGTLWKLDVSLMNRYIVILKYHKKTLSYTYTMMKQTKINAYKEVQYFCQERIFQSIFEIEKGHIIFFANCRDMRYPFLFISDKNLNFRNFCLFRNILFFKFPLQIIYLDVTVENRTIKRLDVITKQIFRL